MEVQEKKSHENKITMTVYGSYDRFTFVQKKSFQEAILDLAFFFLSFFLISFFLSFRKFTPSQ